MKSEITEAEWNELGVRLFGDDRAKWQFVCPSCAHVQTIEDFRPFKDTGATPDSAWQECIGRYDGHMDRDAFGVKDGGPCNYAAYGLFRISPITVIKSGGLRLRVFAFAGQEVEAA